MDVPLALICLGVPALNPTYWEKTTLLWSRSRRVLRILVDDGHQPCNRISQAGRRCRESWRTIGIHEFRFPVSPLLVQVLFPDAGAPYPSFGVVGGADFEDAVPRGVV